jgi:hypothetical protein
MAKQHVKVPQVERIVKGKPFSQRVVDKDGDVTYVRHAVGPKVTVDVDTAAAMPDRLVPAAVLAAEAAVEAAQQQAVQAAAEADLKGTNAPAPPAPAKTA